MIKGIIIEWKSSMCNCWAEYTGEGIKYCPCDDEHLPWCKVIGKQGLESKNRDIDKALRRGIPGTFEHIVERYGRDDGSPHPHSFHRPKEVSYDPESLSAEMGLYLKESLGVDLQSCSNPTAYADYLSGKASLGLSEKEWIKDYFNRQPTERRMFWPEEFVVDGLIDLRAAESMFGRDMSPDLLWIAARSGE